MRRIHGEGELADARRRCGCSEHGDRHEQARSPFPGPVVAKVSGHAWKQWRVACSADLFLAHLDSNLL
jgi:hypothetical protein